MQVTTHQAGLGTPSARLALAQRIALAALAIFLMLNAVTPFITPDPPWLANLPLVIAIMAFLVAFGLSHIRAEGARACRRAGNSKSRKAVGARTAGASCAGFFLAGISPPPKKGVVPENSIRPDSRGEAESAHHCI